MLRDQRDKCPPAPGDNNSLDAWTARIEEELARLSRPKPCSSPAKPLLVRMVVRVAIQLLQVFAGQFILWIDFEGAFKVQSRLF